MTASNTQPAAIEWIEGGGVTTPGGFVAGGTYANIKTYGEAPRMDVGILATTGPCTVAGVFTRNAVVGEPPNVSVTLVSSVLVNAADGISAVTKARNVGAAAAPVVGPANT